MLAAADTIVVMWGGDSTVDGPAFDTFARRAGSFRFGLYLAFGLTLMGVVGALPLVAAAEQATPPAHPGLGPLPQGVTFQPIRHGTADELVLASSLVNVTRFTFSPGFAVLGMSCGDGITDGPQVIYLESGALEVTTGVKGAVDPALLLSATGGQAWSAPKLVVPGTWLALHRGDLLVPQQPSDCDMFMMNRDGTTPATFLQLTFFWSQPVAAGFGGNGATVEPLDLNLGVSTVQRLAPPVVAFGYLTLAPGARSQPSKELAQAGTTPVAAYVKEGTLQLELDRRGGVVKRAGTGQDAPVEKIQPATPATLAGGDAAYLPPGATSILRNTGDTPLVVLIIAVVPPAAMIATPTP